MCLNLTSFQLHFIIVNNIATSCVDFVMLFAIEKNSTVEALSSVRCPGLLNR